MTRLDESEIRRGDELELVVDGRTYTGWKAVSVTRELNSAAGKFTVSTVSTRAHPFPVRPGHSVKVRVGEDVLVDGYVDELSASGGPDSKTLRVAGRDRTALLVDCSAQLPDPATADESGETLAARQASQFADLRLVELATILARPFAVGIVNEIGGWSGQGEPFGQFKLQTGESPWSAIERACRLRAALAYSDGQGDLVLAQPGRYTSDIPLVEGGEQGNIIRSAVRYTYKDRFRFYTVRGQDQGSDEAWGESVALVEGTAIDPEIRIHRPLLIVPEGKVTFDSANDRAQWEATIRAARSAVLTVEVQGWRKRPAREGGELWRINELVPVRIPSLSIANVLLVDSITFARDDSKGTMTSLRLVRKDSYQPQPVVPVEDNPFDELLTGDQTDLESWEDYQE